MPGTYTLRITANGTTRSTRVTVRNDPRATATAAALSAQHVLQMQLMAGMRVAHEGQTQVDALRASLTQAATGAPTEVAAAIGALRAAIDAAVGAAVGAEATATTTGKFRDTNGALASQLTAQNHADHAPNAGMLAAFAATSRQLSATHTAWARILARDLPALNAVRTRLGLTPVPAPGR